MPSDDPPPILYYFIFYINSFLIIKIPGVIGPPNNL